MVLSISSGILCTRFGDIEGIKLFAQAGFDAVDYSFESISDPENPWNTKKPEDYAKELLELAGNFGIYYNQAHAACVFDWDDPDVIEKAVKPQVVRSIQYASMLNIPHIIVHELSHPAVNHSDEERMRVNIDYFNYLKPFAKKYGIKIALENLKKVCTTPDEYEALMNALNDDVFVACVDLGHSFYVGQDAAEITRRLGHDRVKALHVHDNQGNADDHQIPGFGKIDWNHLLEALADIDYTGDFNLELVDFITGMQDSKHGFDDDFALDSVRIAEICGRYLKNKLERMIKEKNCRKDS